MNVPDKTFEFVARGMLFTSVTHQIFLEETEQAEALKRGEDSYTLEGRRGNSRQEESCQIRAYEL